MRRDAYEHLQKLSNTFFNNTKVGQIMGRITNDLFDVTEFAHHFPEEFFIAAVKGIAAFIILSLINLPLTLAIFAVIPIMLLVCIRINRRMRRSIQKAASADWRAKRQNRRQSARTKGCKSVYPAKTTETGRFEEDNQNFLKHKA